MIDYAKSKGFLCKKHAAGPWGGAGWPDFSLHRNGAMIYMEFKRKGGKLTPLQTATIEDIRNHGIYVIVVDCVEYGKAIVDKLP